MEYRDLYDNFRNPLGKCIQKGEKVPEGCYYVTVAIVMEDKKGNFLLQRRSKQKGGLWATTGGHPKSGETSLEGIITEVNEEMGLNIENEDIQLFKTIKTEDDFVDYYYVKMDIDEEKITLQEEEVQDYMFASKQKILQMIDDGLFHPKHAGMMLEYFKYKEDNI